MSVTLSAESGSTVHHVTLQSDIKEDSMSCGDNQNQSRARNWVIQAIKLGKTKHLGVTQVVFGILFILYRMCLCSVLIVPTPVHKPKIHRTHLVSGLLIIVCGIHWFIPGTGRDKRVLTSYLVMNFISGFMVLLDVFLFNTDQHLCMSKQIRDYCWLFVVILWTLALLELIVSAFGSILARVMHFRLSEMQVNQVLSQALCCVPSVKLLKEDVQPIATFWNVNATQKNMEQNHTISLVQNEAIQPIDPASHPGPSR